MYQDGAAPKAVTTPCMAAKKKKGNQKNQQLWLRAISPSPFSCRVLFLSWPPAVSPPLPAHMPPFFALATRTPLPLNHCPFLVLIWHAVSSQEPDMSPGKHHATSSCSWTRGESCVLMEAYPPSYSIKRGAPFMESLLECTCYGDPGSAPFTCCPLETRCFGKLSICPLVLHTTCIVPDDCMSHLKIPCLL